MCRDPEQIAKGWGEFFRKLYSATEVITSDGDLNSAMREQVRIIKSDNTHAEISVGFSCADVKNALKQCKKGKACGGDQIQYEHMIYGGEKLCSVLSDLYSSMLLQSYTPTKLKRGTIITIHKGGKKCKDDPNNYRAITLNSTLLKNNLNA